MTFVQAVSSRCRAALFFAGSPSSFAFVPAEVTEQYCRIPALRYGVLEAATALRRRFLGTEGATGSRRMSSSCDSSSFEAGHHKGNRSSHFPCFSFVLPSHHLIDVFNERAKCVGSIVNDGMYWSYRKDDLMSQSTNAVCNVSAVKPCSLRCVKPLSLDVAR
jgi:hypothetical protein